MLLQIREYITRERVVNIQQLTRAFGVDLPTLEPMLNLWIRKGVIQKIQQDKACNSSCFKCRPQSAQFYVQAIDK